MLQTKTINSESEIRKDIIRKFKQYRVVDQIAFYLNDRADLYYNPDKKTSRLGYDYPKIAQLLKNVLVKEANSRTAIISLGCGDCDKDKVILEHLQDMGYNIPFFGVDSSMSMLYKANKTLSNVTFKARLICANFGALEFKEELDNIIKSYDLKIFLLLGNTLGNLHQGYIADILNNILNTGDYLLLDVAGFDTITAAIQANLFKKYLKYNKASSERIFHLGPIKAMGVSEDCGKLTLEVTTDDATQARAFNFGFRIHNLTKLNLEGSEVILSSNEYISLIHILVYDLQKLVEFLEERSFMFKEQILGDLGSIQKWDKILIKGCNYLYMCILFLCF